MLLAMTVLVVFAAAYLLANARPARARAPISSQQVHFLGFGKRALATCLVISSVPPFSLRHRRGELGFQSMFRFFHRGGRRLMFGLGRYRLRRRQPRKGIAVRLPDSHFELRDIGATRSRLG